MLRPEKQFPIGTRIRLKDGVDPSFYDGFSRVGNEGWVRKAKRDRYGYPEVYVEFDRDHWAYNGQPDCWTMEGQFEAAEEMDMSEPASNPNESRDDKVRDLTETFIRSLFGALGVEEDQEAATPAAVDPEGWDKLASAAAEAVQKAPAYVVIALEHMQVDGAPPMIIPRVFHAAREPDYRLITQSHLAHVLASMQDETIAGVLSQRVTDDEEG